MSGRTTCVLFTLLFCSGLGHQHTKGANGSRYQCIYEPTAPSQPMMSDDATKIDDNSGNYVPYSNIKYRS